MQRIVIVALLLGLVGCVNEPGGRLDFTISGAADLSPDLSGEVVIDWDGENAWTRELACQLDSDLQDSWWGFNAVDRSVGNGLAVAMKILEYDGDAEYVRDRFQPESAFSIEHEDADTGVRTLIDVGVEGSCNIVIEEGSLSGSFTCADVPLQTDGVETGTLVSVTGNFLCNSLDRAAEGGDRRTRTFDDDGDEDDRFED